MYTQRPVLHGREVECVGLRIASARSARALVTRTTVAPDRGGGAVNPSADEILEDAVEFGEMAAGQAKKTSFELRRKAEIESEKLKKKGVSLKHAPHFWGKLIGDAFKNDANRF